jgi:TolB-like protein/DNA-binding SARP family transcriptional activator
MSSEASMAYAFDRFVLDLRRGVLLADGAECSLRPKSLLFLRYLVENAGRVVDRDEIMNAVWPGVFVTDDSIAQCVRDIRRALGDGEQRLLRTMTRRGYLLTAAVVQSGERPVSGAPPTAEPSHPVASQPAVPDKPSIAVLPFQNMSGDPEQEYFVDGMVEEIITALSRIRWLFVIARNSTFSYKGQAPDIKQVGRELGVRYVLEGSVRKGGNRVRITGQLIDADSAAHLWADRFDGAMEEVFELQDKVASSVAGVIEPALQAAETARSAGRPTTDLAAYDLYLRGYAMALTSARQVPEALRLMEQAIARDPRYGPALAWAACCYIRLLIYDWSEDREADALKGADFARRALEAAADDPVVLANAAYALAILGEDIDAMMALADRALALNQNFARGWHLSGILRLLAGELTTAIEHAEASLHLSPRARLGTTLLTIGGAHFASQRFGQALPKLQLAVQEDPNNPNTYRYLAACYAHMGRLDDAREVVERLRPLTSIVIPDARYLRNPEHRGLFLSGLRLATGKAD